MVRKVLSEKLARSPMGVTPFPPSDEGKISRLTKPGKVDVFAASNHRSRAMPTGKASTHPDCISAIVLPNTTSRCGRNN